VVGADLVGWALAGGTERETLDKFNRGE